MPKIEISISDILEYLGDRVRPLKEGEAVLKAGHIILCGLDVSQPSKLKALCLQTSALSKPPHEIDIDLSGGTWQCKCTCKAGLSGYCKHIVGTLIYINRNEDLEYVSCTDLQQKWGQEKKGVQEEYVVKPFTSFCHPTTKKKITFQASDEINKKNFELLVAGVGTSALSRFMGKFSNEENNGPLAGVGVSSESMLSRYVNEIILNMSKSQFLDDLEITRENLKFCCKSLVEDMAKADAFKIACYTKQGSDEWQKERQLRITGSICYSLYTYGKRGNVDWENKANQFLFPKGFKNKFIEHGLKYEEEALETFRKRHNVDVVTPSLIIAKSLPWLAYSPDGVVFEGGIPVGLLEVKCPYIGKDHGPEAFTEHCDFLEIIDSNIRLKVAHKYYAQIQFGMAILNLQKTHFLVYSSFLKEYLEIIVNFDENFTKELIEVVSKKYFENIIHYYCLSK